MEVCPVCGSRMTGIAARDDGYTYYGCPACDLVTALPVPSKEEIAAYYNGFLFGKPKGGDFRLRRQLAVRNARHIVSDMRRIAGLREGVKLLDLGGGTGFCANGFAQSGLDVTLFDIDSQACAYAASHFAGAFAVVNADPLEYRFEHEFDVVFCNHVVEHVAELHVMMETIRRAGKRGSLVVLATPNRYSREVYLYYTQLWQYLRPVMGGRLRGLPRAFVRFVQNPWICCSPPRHLHAFSARSLRCLLRVHGFRSLRSFTEYSRRQYYSPRIKLDNTLKRPASLLKVLKNVCMETGLATLGMVDREGMFGSNLVAYARAP